MSTKKALFEQRGKFVEELTNLENVIKSESRGFSDDELNRVDAIQAELEKIERSLKSLETIERAKGSNPNPGFGDSSKSEERELAKMAEKYSLGTAMRTAWKGGKIDGVYAEFDTMARNEFMDSGVTHDDNALKIPTHLLAHKALRLSKHRDSLKRAMTVTGGSPVGEQGGYNVQTDVMGIVEVLKPYMALGDLGITALSGLRGNLSWPKASQGYTGGSWNTENGTATEISPEFTELTMSPKRLAAFVEVSKQLLAQSNNSIDAYVLDLLLTTMAVKMERAFILGGGSNEPVGILSNTEVTKLFAGNAASNSTNPNGAPLVWRDITKLARTVLNNNAIAANYLSNFDVMEALQNTSKQASGTEGNYILKDDVSVLNGRSFAQTTNVPNTLTKGTSSDLSAIICGDFSKLITGSWGGVELIRDGITGAKSNKDTLVMNAYADMVISQPSAFAFISDADTSF
jgi:HK97 family phage major capsid protein